MNPTPVDIVTVQDFPNTSGQNINPLTTEDLKKILHQTTVQAQLCTNPVLVSVEEWKKAIDKITRDKVNSQEPTSHIQTTTSGQPQDQAVQDTPARVDSIVIVTTTVEE